MGSSPSCLSQVFWFIAARNKEAGWHVAEDRQTGGFCGIFQQIITIDLKWTCLILIKIDINKYDYQKS